MIGGCSISTTGRFKVGAAFVAYKTRIGADTETYGWYSDELGGWLSGTPSADSRNVSNGESFYSDSGCTQALGTVSAGVTLCVVSCASVGSGSCSVSSTLYGGRYAAQGSSVTFSSVAGSGRKELSFTVNGVASAKTVTASADLTAIATFVPTSYSVSHEATSGGTSIVTVGGENLPSGNTKSGVAAGTEVVVSATPNSGMMFLYAEIDGRRFVTNPTVFTIEDRTDDSIFNVKCVFGSVSSMTDQVVVTGSGDVVVTRDGSEVELDDNGRFEASVGAIYVVSATPESGMKVGGFYENGRLVSTASSYTFVQDAADRVITVAFVAESPIVVNLFCGGDTSSQSESWNGCTCSVVVPSGSTIGTYTFTPHAASGYHFVRLYIEDGDGTGKGRVIPAGQSLAVVIDFNARIVAIFAADLSPVEPQDEDQGNATRTTATMKEWEGGLAHMVATWRSKRNVFPKPVALSSVRVYANGYGVTLPSLKIATYESPATSDGRETELHLRNQDARRIPSRRPEKYVELEVKSDERVLELAVSTSMEGLWQRSS